MPVDIDECQNCGARIGRLEVPFVWQNHIVCAKCHARLCEGDTEGIEDPLEYVDHLAFPRFVLLLLALGFSVFPVLAGQQNPNYTAAWIFWAAWIAIGLAGIVLKANWKLHHR